MTTFGKDTIQKIISSTVFKNKDTSARLLEYLYETTIKNRTLKELDIASEFFHRGDKFIPGEDTIVRVNISKLRQMLKLYYQGEGKNDGIVISIPQRKYELFVTKLESSVDATAQTTVENGNRLRGGWSNTPTLRELLLGTVLVISLIANGFFLVRMGTDKTSGRKYHPHPVWSDFARSDLSNSLILGNPQFFEAVNAASGVRLVVRDLAKNDANEAASHFQTILQGYEIADLPYPYFSHNNVWALSEIFGAVGNENPLIIKTKTETTPDDFSRGNVIFVSNINTFGYVQQYLRKTSLGIDLSPARIRLNDGTVFQNAGDHNDQFTEYGFFVKIPGESGNAIVLLGDSSSTGITGAVKIMSEPALFENLMKQFGYTEATFPQYFEMVVRSGSYKHSGVATDVVHFRAID